MENGKYKITKVGYVKPQVVDLGAFASLLGGSGCSDGTGVGAGNCFPVGNAVATCLTGNIAATNCPAGNGVL